MDKNLNLTSDRILDNDIIHKIWRCEACGRTVMNGLKYCLICVPGQVQASAPARDEAITIPELDIRQEDRQQTRERLAYCDSNGDPAYTVEAALDSLACRERQIKEFLSAQPSEADTISAPKLNNSGFEYTVRMVCEAAQQAGQQEYQHWTHSTALTLLDTITALRAELAQIRANHLEAIEALLAQLAERDALLTDIRDRFLFRSALSVHQVADRIDAVLGKREKKIISDRGFCEEK